MVSAKLTADERQAQVVRWLRERPALKIEAIQAELGVSRMTVHRDLAALEGRGIVERFRGGVRLRSVDERASTDRCSVCMGEVNERLQCVATSAAGVVSRTCCAHCLLMQHDQLVVGGNVLVRDFVYGRMVSSATAFYVFGSRVALCCEPSVIAFRDEADAWSFQGGFGGQVSDLAGAVRLVRELCSSGR